MRLRKLNRKRRKGEKPMKHARKDYDRIQDLDGLIPEMENWPIKKVPDMPEDA
jgi:hypothetical protein